MQRVLEKLLHISQMLAIFEYDTLDFVMSNPGNISGIIASYFSMFFVHARFLADLARSPNANSPY